MRTKDNIPSGIYKSEINSFDFLTLELKCLRPQILLWVSITSRSDDILPQLVILLLQVIENVHFLILNSYFTLL